MSTLHLGKALREIRKRKGILLKVLAYDLGVTPSNVSYYERMTSIPRRVSLDKICAALGVDVSVVMIFAVPEESIPWGSKHLLRELKDKLIDGH